MARARSHISVSLDGYVAGPGRSNELPLGERGEDLHEWALATAAWRGSHGLEGGTEGEDSRIIEESTEGLGAYIMGRGMFGPEGGPDEDWNGWWGDEPPYHLPVYVLTSHPREPLEMDGGTTFHFVTEGPEAALAAAREAAGDADVAIVGGGLTISQYLRIGAIDELTLHIAPIVLGGGTPLFTDAGVPRLEPVEVIGSPRVTHVRYRVG